MQISSFSLAISGSLFLGLQWHLALTPLRPEQPVHFCSSGFESFLVIRRCRTTVSASSMQPHHCIYSGLGLRGGRWEYLQCELLCDSLCGGSAGRRGSSSFVSQLGCSHLSAQHESDTWVPGLGRLFFNNKKGRIWSISNSVYDAAYEVVAPVGFTKFLVVISLLLSMSNTG